MAQKTTNRARGRPKWKRAADKRVCRVSGMVAAAEKDAFCAYVEERAADEDSGILSESDAVRALILETCRREGYL